MSTGSNFDLYKSAVVAAYQTLKEAGELRPGLLFPARGKLHKECLFAVETRWEKRDENLLRSFFEMTPDSSDFRAAVKDWDPEDLRTLDNFVKKPTIGTDEPNVEILAWLINFEDRPFARFMQKQLAHVEPPSNPTTGPVTDPPGQKPPPVEPPLPVVQPSGPKPANRSYYISLAISAAVIASSLLFYSLQGKPECMYWDGSAYQKSACDIIRPDTPNVPLERDKLQGFRRVMPLASIKRSAVGRLYYARVGDSIEVFTTKGVHPVYPDKDLEKMTDYIYNSLQSGKYGLLSKPSN